MIHSFPLTPAASTARSTGPGGEMFARRSRRLIAVLWATAVVLTATAWITALFLTDRDFQQTMNRAERDTANLTRIIAEQTARAIGGTDELLTFAAYDLHRFGATSANLRDVFRNAVENSEILLQLAVTDADGNLIQTSVEDAPTGVNLGDREHFRVHKDGIVQGAFISRPVFGRASGKWSIQLSRRINAPDGGFGGIIVASLDPFYFSRIFSALDVGEKGAVMMAGYDGILRARSVMDGTVLGMDIGQGNLMQAARSHDTGFIRSTSLLDNTRRLIGFRSVAGYPLFVAVGFDEASFLAGTHTLRWVAMGVAGVLSLILLVVAVVGTLQIRAQSRAHATLASTAAQLRAREFQLRDILETASDWFWEMDENFRFTGFSGSFRAFNGDQNSLLGHRRDEIAARPREEDAAWREHLETLAAHRPFRHFEYTIAQPDGEIRIWSVSGKPIFGEDGRFAGYRGSGYDVTDVRRAERALAASEQRYRSMVEAVRQPIIVTDDAGIVTGFNPAAEGLFGHPAAAVTGRNVAILLADGKADLAPGTRERDIRRADGGTVTVEWAWSVWHSGGQRHFTAIIWDISQAKRIESDLRLARDSAENASRLKSQFLATISHEIRTPMNAVLGSLTLLSGSPLVADDKRLVEVARQSAEGLLRLLDDILDFSKLESGKITLEEVVCAPAALVADVISMFQPTAGEKGLALSFQPDPSLPDAIVSDPARLRQILFNLVGNAIKFTPAGHVTVRARLGEQRDDGMLRVDFAVEDTGIGISAHTLPTLFERFTQADTSVTRRFGGTGLGLAICRELCALLGGSISVDSIPGKGSLFRFSIVCPRGDAGSLPSGGDSPAPAPRLPPLRVLVVDDNTVNREILRKLLERAGHMVDTAEDGGQAVDMARHTRFDVVLMDVQMPTMDGLTATRLIRALPPPANGVPVIALTAHASGSSRPECLSAGMDGFAAKPLRPAQLFQEIAAVLDKRDQEPERVRSAI